MSFELSDIHQGILTARFSGELTPTAVAELQRATAHLLQTARAFRLLVILEDFQGFGDGNWNATSVQSQNDDKIDRIAIVGDKRWEDAALMFTGKGLRRAEIEYFESHDLPKAHAWLAA